MGIGRLLKKLFAPQPLQLDYSQLEPEELRERYLNRGELTDEARSALEREFERRGMRPEALEDRAEAEQSAEPELGPEASPLLPGGEVPPHTLFRVVAPNGLLLWTAGSSYILLLFPLAQEAGGESRVALPELDEGEEVTALILVDPAGVGHLETARTVAALDLPSGAVFALSNRHAVDRPASGAETQSAITARELARRSDFEKLTLQRTSEAPNILRAEWFEEQTTLLIGQRVPPGVLLADPTVTHVVGGLSPRASDTEDDWQRLLETAGGSEFRDLVLCASAFGVEAEPARSLIPSCGVRLQIVGPIPGPAPPGQQLQEAIERDDSDSAKRLLEESDAALIEPVLEGLALAGRHEEMAKITSAGTEARPEEGRYVYWAGVAADLAGDYQTAMTHFQSALRAERPEPSAHTTLAARLVWPSLTGSNAAPTVEELEKAAEHMRAYREARPREPQAVHLELVVAFKRGPNEARAAFEQDHVVDTLAPHLADSLAELLEEPAQWSNEALAKNAALAPRAWPRLARRAVLLARNAARERDIEGAERLLAKARRFDPLLEAAVVESAELLTAEERGPEALPLLDELLARFETAAHARLKRADTLLRLGLEASGEGEAELTEAAREFQNCIDLEPTWRHARLGLISSLMHLARYEDAAEELRALAAAGAPEVMVMAIDRQLRAARGQGAAVPQLVSNRRGRLGI